MVESYLPNRLLRRSARSSDVRQPPKWLYKRSSRWFTITVVSFSIFTDLFLYSLVVPVLPFALSERAGISSQDVQHWVSILLTVYGVSLLVGSPIAGYLSDRMQTRNSSFLSGLLVLLGATLMFCFARSIALLLVARILQGLSAAVVWTVAVTILSDRVGAKGTGAAMGWAMLGRTSSVILGPVLGGVVYAGAGYYAVFSMAFACMGIDVVLRLLLIDARTARKWDPKIGPDDQDEPNPGVLEDPEKQNGGTSAESAPTSAPPAGTMLETEKPCDPAPLDHAQQPQPQHGKQQSLYRRILLKLPPAFTLLLTPRFFLAMWGCVFQAMIITGLDAVIPLFVSRTFHWTSSGAGLLFLAFVIPSVATPIVGHLSDRHGPKLFAVLGYVLMVPPLVLLRLVVHNTLRQKVLLGALLAWMGLASACFEIPVWVEIVVIAEMKGLEDPELFGDRGAIGQAYGLGNMGWALGAVLGPVWAGFVYQSAGWGTMGWTLGLLCAVSAVPTAILTGGYLFESKKNIKGKEKSSNPVASNDCTRPEERDCDNANEGKQK
ncbi:MAG: hypothetical protein Q9160_005032 [Pyrenula sp. 1 TL-2023]